MSAGPAKDEASAPGAGDAAPPNPRRRNWLVALPLVLFGGLAGIFLTQLLVGGDPSEVPSVLIGKTAPETKLPPLAGLTTPGGKPVPGLDLTGFGDGKPILVNVFASWCAPCREEQPLLMRLSRDERFDLVAIDYKDKPADALAFLRSLGNPFGALGVDQKGTATIDWGVYGVPESFLVSPDGEIVFKQTGPFTEASLDEDFLPALEKVLAGEPKPTASKN